MEEKRGGWNRGNAHNVVYISRQLRAGKEPKDLGAEWLGEGVQNTAWKIVERKPHTGEKSEIVIKSFVQGYINKRKPSKEVLKAFGARLPETTRAKQWVIQEKVTPIFHLNPANHRDAFGRYHQMNVALGRNSRHEYDLHAGNVGLAEDGQTLVVFDW
jgi:hypothetical protein